MEKISVGISGIEPDGLTKCYYFKSRKLIRFAAFLFPYIEPTRRIELRFSVYKTVVIPLYYAGCKFMDNIQNRILIKKRYIFQ